MWPKRRSICAQAGPQGTMPRATQKGGSMRRAIFLFVAMSIANMGDAQIGGVVVTPVPPIAVLPSYSYSTSEIDHNGNVLVFDTMYSYPVPPLGQPFILQPPTVKTR